MTKRSKRPSGHGVEARTSGKKMSVKTHMIVWKTGAGSMKR